MEKYKTWLLFDGTCFQDFYQNPDREFGELWLFSSFLWDKKGEYEVGYM